MKEIFVLFVVLTLCSAHYLYPGHFPNYRNFHHQHQHHHPGCNHEETIQMYKYPFLAPVLNHLESGHYSPNQMKEMQDDINQSVQKGIQAWNKRESRTGEIDEGQPFNIDLRSGNNNTTDTSN